MSRVPLSSVNHLELDCILFLFEVTASSVLSFAFFLSDYLALHSFAQSFFDLPRQS
jgi:hypothetical protein